MHNTGHMYLLSRRRFENGTQVLNQKVASLFGANHNNSR